MSRVMEKLIQPANGNWSATFAAAVLGNVTPLLGVLGFNWNLTQMLMLYWAESAVVGVYTILRMNVAHPLKALPSSVVFVVHYGAFMFIHAVILMSMIEAGFFGRPPAPRHEPSIEMLLSYLLQPMALVGIVALLLSHGITFITAFLSRPAARDRPLQQLMVEPYPRIIFMHVALIAGAVVVLVFGSHDPFLILLIVLKLLIDLGVIHNRTT